VGNKVFRNTPPQIREGNSGLISRYLQDHQRELEERLRVIESAGGYYGAGVKVLNTFPNNLIVNGDFQVWQDGSAPYTPTFPGPLGGPGGRNLVDMWTWLGTFATGDFTYTRTTVTDLPGFKNALRCQRVPGKTISNSNPMFLQDIESEKCYPLRNQLGYISCWARVGADWSSINPANGNSGAAIRIFQSSVVDDAYWRAAPYTNIGGTVALMNGVSTVWKRFSIPITFAANMSSLAFAVSFQSFGTAGANDWIEITGCQLNVGYDNGIFQGKPFARELFECQRYYQRSFPYGVAPVMNVGNTIGAHVWMSGVGPGAATFSTIRTYTQMFKTPAITWYNPLAAVANTTRNLVTNINVNAATQAWTSMNQLGIGTVVDAGGAAAHWFGAHWVADARI